jgi:8-oxo-dGTP pyrophosphatase MutT (NUDIX family)
MTPAHGGFPANAGAHFSGMPTADTLERLRSHLLSRHRRSIVETGSRPAAVLVPIVSTDDGAALLCFERPTTVLEHRGEICFPGGSIDDEDADAIAAALRETREELGIDARAIEVVGLLDDVRTAASRYVITPVVGYLASRPMLSISEAEVARALYAPIDRCIERESRRLEQTSSGERFVYSYDIAGDVIWGATARIIHALLEAMLAVEKEIP